MKKRFRDIKKQKHNKTTKTLNRSIVYARYIDKVKAFITDLFMIYTPILYLMTYVVLGGKEEFQHSNLAPFIAVVLYGVIYAVLIAKFGQTPGKKAYNLKVVDAQTYEHISFIRAFGRFLAFLLSATILIGLILPWYNKEKKALHDMITGTVEIEEKDGK